MNYNTVFKSNEMSDDMDFIDISREANSNYPLPQLN